MPHARLITRGLCLLKAMPRAFADLDHPDQWHRRALAANCLDVAGRS